MDCIHYKVREDGRILSRAAYIVLGVTLDGYKDILSITVGANETSKSVSYTHLSAKENNTGCVLCLDSCATGIVSDAAWPTGTTQNDVAKFYGDKDVLPEDGTQVTVVFRLAK